MGRCAHPRGWHQSLRGRDAQGAFRTSIAKIYPEELNRAIADSVVTFCSSFAQSLQWVEPLDALLVPLLSYDFVTETCVQPDFYG